jgi:alpha-ribazole phosphatase
MIEAVGQLTVVRHAPLRQAGRCIGRLDIVPLLSPAGAATVMQRALPDTIDRIWTSPARRCAAPATLLGAALGVPVMVDERVCELSFGRWEGSTWQAIERDDAIAVRRWMNDWMYTAPPGGESGVDLLRRVRSWWESLDGLRHHLLVGHAGVIRALRMLALALTPSEAMTRSVRHLWPEQIPLP